MQHKLGGVEHFWNVWIRGVYLAGQRADLSLGFVQSPGQLVALFQALVKFALRPLQLQAQRLPLRLQQQQQ